MPPRCSTASVCDWNQAVQAQSLQVDCALNGGRVEALVEASDDGFRSITGRQLVPLAGKCQTYDVSRLPVARQARVRLRLFADPERKSSPAVTTLRLEARPARRPGAS